MKNKKDKFIQGYACAVACAIQQIDEVNTITKELFQSGLGSMTIQQLTDAGVDEHDIEVFKKYWRELH